MTKRRLWIIITLLATLLVAGVIFSFSAQKGEDSNALGSSIIEPVVAALYPGIADMAAPARQALLETITFVVRKLAHFSEFALLGLCLMAHVHLVRWEKPMKGSGLIAWAIATLYACSDEWHQMFVSDRSPELRDVGIDSAGALCGILFMAACFALAARRRARKAP